MSDSFSTVWTAAHQAVPSVGFPRQEHWSGLPFLLQGIFSTQGWNPNLLHWQQILYHWAIGEALWSGVLFAQFKNYWKTNWKRNWKNELEKFPGLMKFLSWSPIWGEIENRIILVKYRKDYFNRPYFWNKALNLLARSLLGQVSKLFP